MENASKLKKTVDFALCVALVLIGAVAVFYGFYKGGMGVITIQYGYLVADISVLCAGISVLAQFKGRGVVGVGGFLLFPISMGLIMGRWGLPLDMVVMRTAVPCTIYSIFLSWCFATMVKPSGISSKACFIVLLVILIFSVDSVWAVGFQMFGLDGHVLPALGIASYVFVMMREKPLELRSVLLMASNFFWIFLQFQFN
ncbi:hypothetical protein [Photobacterium damselae]|uniref:hypothetical protein n=1 Tax=Photobacterium damselae TaxID=38293 RepID=UPI004067898C